MSKDKGPINISNDEIEAARKAHNVTPIKPVQYVSPMGMTQIQNEIPPIKQYALHPIIPVQGIIFVYAASGVGKTMFSLNLAYAIASGGNFLKYSAPKPRKVLYIDGEMAYVDIHSRLMQIVNQQGNLDFPENFMIYTPDKLIPEGHTQPIRMPKICQAEGQMFYEMAIERHDIDVIVVDNLSMLATIDFDKAHEVYILNDWFLSLRAKGKTLIVVHHSGKDPETYRGSSRMLDPIDTAISLQTIEESLPDQSDDESALGKRFKIVYKKNRSFFGKDAFPYEVTFLNEKWSHRNIELSVMDKIISCISAGMNQRDIAKELLISQSTLHRMIQKGRKQGLIRGESKPTQEKV
jgi:hypothetical protein